MRRVARHVYNLGSRPGDLSGVKSLWQLPFDRGRQANDSRVFPVGVVVFLRQNMKANRKGNSGFDGLDLRDKLDICTGSLCWQGEDKDR